MGRAAAFSAEAEEGRTRESESDDSSDDSDSDDDSSGSGSDSSDSESDSSEDGSDGDDDGSEEPYYEMGFWESLKATLPFTEAGKQADYAEERLDALHEMEEELFKAKTTVLMLERGLHDQALEGLMAATEGQMYHEFHYHRHREELAGEWEFVPPSVKRKWAQAEHVTPTIRRHREYLALRRDKFLQIRELCNQVRISRTPHHAVRFDIHLPDLVDAEMAAMFQSTQANKTQVMMIGGRLVKKCRWRDVDKEGRQHGCTQLRFTHPWRKFKDEVGAWVSDQLTTCSWHANFCVSKIHGDEAVPVTTCNEMALCNECLAVQRKKPLVFVSPFDVKGVRKLLSKGSGKGEDRGAWAREEGYGTRDLPWFIRGAGRRRKEALKPPHPSRPQQIPPAPLRRARRYWRAAPLDPLSKAFFQRQMAQLKWRVEKKALGAGAAVRIQKMYRMYHAGKRRRMMKLEDPECARMRIEAAVVIQALMRRFLAVCLRYQLVAFREFCAGQIQKLIRGHWARKEAAKRRLARDTKNDGLYFTTVAILGALRMARRAKSSHAMRAGCANTIQRRWRGVLGRRRFAAHFRRFGLASYSARQIQRVYRGHRGRMMAQAWRRLVARHRMAATLVQAAFRGTIARSFARRRKGQVKHATSHMARVMRGFIARQRAVRERHRIEAAWRWLNPASRDAYSGFLASTHYSTAASTPKTASGRGTAIGSSTTSLSTSSTTSLSLSSSAEPGKAGTRGGRDGGGRSVEEGESVSRLSYLDGEEHFTRLYDKKRRGMCTKAQFALGLRSLLAERLYPLREKEADAVLMRYYDGDGSCNWFKFLVEYRDCKGFPCAKHNQLVCSVCVLRGRCTSRFCDCDKAQVPERASGKAAVKGYRMCRCGHSFETHTVVHTELRQPNGDWDERRVVSRSKVEACLTRNRMLSGAESAEGEGGEGGEEETPPLLLPASVFAPLSVTGVSMEDSVAERWQQTGGGGSGWRGGRTLRREGTIDTLGGSFTGMGLSRTATLPATLMSVAMLGTGEEEKEQQQQQQQRGAFCQSQSLLSPQRHQHLGQQQQQQQQQQWQQTEVLDWASPQRGKKRGLTVSMSASAIGASTFGASAFGPEEDVPACPSLPKTLSSQAFQQTGQVPSLAQAKRMRQHERAMVHAEERARALEQGEKLMQQGQNAPAYALSTVEMMELNKTAEDKARESLLLAPVQSKKELTCGFLVTHPIPLVEEAQAARGQRSPLQELTVSTQPVDAYLQVLHRLSVSSAGQDLLADGQAMTAFVAHNYATFERHWIKLVKDTTGGSLDEHLPVSAERRRREELRLLPNPKRGRLLEEALRDLGFHDRKGGHFGNKGRRHQRTAAEIAQLERMMPKPKKGVAAKSSPAQARLGAARRLSAPAVEPNALDQLHSPPSRRRQQRGHPPDSMRSVKSPPPSVPRGRSPSAAQVPAHVTAQEASDMGYRLTTLPRPALSGYEKMDRSSRKYLCMHAGCGHVSATERGAHIHEQEHMFCRRLATPTPVQDQYLATCLPEGAPWRPTKRGGTGTLVRTMQSQLADFACPVQGCHSAPFETATALQLHLRVGHTVFQLEATFPDAAAAALPGGGPFLSSTVPGQGQGKGQRKDGPPPPSKSVFLGTYTLCPPLPLPEGVPPIPVCSKHARIKMFCSDCVAILESWDGPVQPLKVFPRVKHTVESAALSSSSSSSDKGLSSRGGAAVTVDLSSATDRSDTCALVRWEDGAPPVPARVRGVLEDGSKRGWITVQRFYTKADIRRDIKDAGSDSSDVSSVQSASSAAASALRSSGGGRSAGSRELVLGKEVDFVPLSAVAGKCFVVTCDAQSFVQKVRHNEVPDGVYFTRHTYSRETLCVTVDEELRRHQAVLSASAAAAAAKH